MTSAVRPPQLRGADGAATLDSANADTRTEPRSGTRRTTPGDDTAVELAAIEHRYGRRSPLVLDGVDLDVATGEVLALLGPSGCGKTTLLRIIAGLVRPTGGRVMMAGRNVTAVPTHRRNVGLVHQNFALWPHMTVAEIVGFGLQMRHQSRARRLDRTAEMLDLVGLSGYEGRFPHQLSGGQQQRVSLARALAFEPTVLLLDEPLSALDANLRQQLQAHLRHLQRTTGVTTLIVTHDREEAMGVSSRIVVLDDGKIQQISTPQGLYRDPASLFVMRFTGECNVLAGTVTPTGTVEVPGLGTLPIDVGGRSVHDAVTVGVRPELLQLHRTDDHGHPSTNGRSPAFDVDALVEDVAFLGPFATFELDVGGYRLTARRESSHDLDHIEPGRTVRLHIPSTAFHIFPKEPTT